MTPKDNYYNITHIKSIDAMRSELSRHITNSKGFTLIELAIVLVIIGFAISAGGSLLALSVKKKAIDTDTARLQSAKSSLVAYSAQNGVIPQDETFINSVPNPLDFGGRKTLYIHDENLTSTEDAVCRKRSTYLKINLCRNMGCSEFITIHDIAFANISAGPNGNIQTQKDTNGVIRIYLQNDKVDDHEGDFLRSESYDDLAEWVTLGELQARSGCENSRLRILNNELPYATLGKDYRATIYADGGVVYTSSNGDYRWCVDDDGMINEGVFNINAGANTVAVSNNCLNLERNLWSQSDNLTLTGTPQTIGATNYLLKFWVRDNNDPENGNDVIASKKLVFSLFN
jgi:prepilin-type N-terminal cleavage/methylation domain-containing protein